LVDHAGVIGDDQETAAVGVGFDLFDDICELVDGFSIAGFPASPLFAVDGAEIAVLIRPFIPNAHAVFFEVADICIARDEP